MNLGRTALGRSQLGGTASLPTLKNFIAGSPGSSSMSEDFDSSTWGFEGGMSVVKNNVANPFNGAMTADTVTWTGPYATLKSNPGITVAAGEKICFSIYAKKGSWNSNFKFYLLTTGYVTVQDVSFDVSGTAGAFTAVDSYSLVTDLGNGWLRISGGMTVASAGSYFPYMGFMSLGAQSMVLWGAMLEKGSLTPTLYQADNATSPLGVNGDHSQTLSITQSAAGTVVAVATGGTAFDPAAKGADIVLSGSNLIATKNADNDQGVRTVLGVAAGERVYAECAQDLGGGIGGWGDYSGFGLWNASAPLTHPGNTTDGIGIYGSGIIVRNEAVEVTTTALTSAGNGRYRIAVRRDVSPARVWLATDGNPWNNDATANPATNVGGIDASSLGSGTWYFGVGMYGSTSVMRLKTAVTDWSYAAPAGFAAVGLPTPWTPADLATRPVAEFNSDNVPWSGSSFATTPNTGTMGGTWGVGTTAAPTKAASAVNGHYPAQFTRASSQGLQTSATANLPVGEKQVFAVVTGLADAHGALIGQNWGVTTGDVWYVRDGGKMVAYNGTPSSLNNFLSTSDPGSGLLHATIRYSTSGYTLPNQLRKNGVDDLSFVSNPTYASASNTDSFWIGESGTHYGGEFLTGQVLYAMESVGLPDSEVQKLEGWASWTYAGDGSLLPVGHPYKSAAPTLSAGPAAVNGAHSQVLPITRAATGTVTINGDHSKLLGLLQSSTAGVVVAGAHAQTLAIGQSSAGTTPVAGNHTQTLVFGKTQAGTVAVAGAHSKLLGLLLSSIGYINVAAPGRGRNLVADNRNYSYLPANGGTIAGYGGVTATVAGRGVLPDGTPYIDLRWAGTAVGANYLDVTFSDLLINGFAGEKYSLQLKVALQAGAIAGAGGYIYVAPAVLGADYGYLTEMSKDGGGSFYASYDNALTSTLTAYSGTGTFPSTTGAVYSNFRIQHYTPDGQTVDVTVRVAGVQYEKSATVSALIYVPENYQTQTINQSAAGTVPSSAVNGNHSQTLVLGFTSAGDVDVTGLHSQTLPLGNASAGDVDVAGAHSKLLGLTGAAAGGVAVTGLHSQTLPLTGAAAGSVAVNGSHAQTLAFGGSASGTVAVNGSHAQTLPIVNAGTGAVTVNGAHAQTLPLTQTAAGNVGATAVNGAAAQTISQPAQAASGAVQVTGTHSQAVSLQQAVSGALTVNGASAQIVVVNHVASGNLGATASNGAAAQTVVISQAASGGVAVAGAASQGLALGGPNASGAGVVTASGAQVLPLAQTANGTVGAVVTINGNHSQTLVIGSSASGGAQVAAASAQILAFPQVAAGGPVVGGNVSAQIIAFPSSASGTAPAGASAAQTLGFAQAAVATVVIRGSAAQIFGVGQTLNGTVEFNWGDVPPSSEAVQLVGRATKVELTGASSRVRLRGKGASPKRLIV
jgi:hypothetical protein